MLTSISAAGNIRSRQHAGKLVEDAELTAIELRQHFLSQANWVNPDKTVDRVIMGDPKKDIRRILVTWISSLQAIEIAIQRGFDMLITHEPTFWSHWDEEKVKEQTEAGRRKTRMARDAGLVIYRNHDVWDRMPNVGIPWAWAEFLGLGAKPACIFADGYQHRYDIEPTTFQNFARRIAEKTAILGEPVIQVVGEAEQVVSRVGIGTGCGCDPLLAQEAGCDVSIVCDDGACYWGDIQRAIDSGHPIVRVNHSTSEEPGMASMTSYLRRTFPQLTVEHLPCRAAYRLVLGGAGA